MDEEEYEALTEEEKFMFDREVQQALRERKKRWESRAGTCTGCTAHPGDWVCPPEWPQKPREVSRETSCPPSVLVGTALQGFSHSALLSSLCGVHLRLGGRLYNITGEGYVAPVLSWSFHWLPLTTAPWVWQGPLS